MNEFLEYNIDQFIESACQMAFVDLLEVCKKNYQSLDNRKVSSKPENANRENFIKEYKDYIRELLFLLNTGSKPQSMNEEYFQKSKRIFKCMVERGQIDAEWLDVFNKDR
ncbi:MAG TPA: hypothetical protein VII28_01330 [Puia sp.]